MSVKARVIEFKDSVEETAYCIEMGRCCIENKGRRAKALNYAEAIASEVWYRWLAPAICKARGHSLIETGHGTSTSGYTEVSCARCGRVQANIARTNAARRTGPTGGMGGMKQ